MPSSLSSLVSKAQSVKAQSLATLMAALDPVRAVAGVGGNEADNPQARMQSAEAAVKATLIALDAEGKATLEVAGARIEAQLPADLLRAGAKNPDLLRPGARLALPADLPVRTLSTPATRVEVQGQAQGASVGPAPVLASPFPPGSLGAAITRLAGIALPGAEAEVAMPPAVLPATQAPPAIRPGLITHAVQPEILTALVQASGKQVPLAQGLSSLLALPPEALKTLPDSVQAILKSLAGARATPQDIAAPESLQKAVASSGLFMEARLASLPPGSPPPQDLKVLLLALKSLLGEALPEAKALGVPAPAPQGREPRAPDAATPQAPSRPEMQRAVEGTLERIKLTQLASLPEHPEITVTDDRAQPLRLAVSLPLAPQGHDRPATAVLGMVIEHQPAIDKAKPYETEDEGGGETTGFPWKVRIALDLEETGPVQAEIALRGQSVGVTLWAERKVMAEAARAEIGALHAALTSAAFEVVNLEVKEGFPHLTPQRHAPVLDRRT